MLAPRGLAPTLHLASVMLGCQDTGQPMFGNYHQVPQSECQTCEKCLMMVVKVKVPILDILQCKNLLRVCKHLIVLCGSYRVLSLGIVKHFSHVWTQFSCSLWFSTFQLLGMWFVNRSRACVRVPSRRQAGWVLLFQIPFAMGPHDWLFQDKESGEWRVCPTPGLSSVYCKLRSV